MNNRKIGIIGCGNLGTAFIEGLLLSGRIKPQDIIVSDPDRKKLTNAVKSYRVKPAGNLEIAGECRIIFLAVKPKDVKNVCLEIKSRLDGSKIVVSFAAGITIRQLEKFTGNKTPVLRVMPNLPVALCKGVMGYAPGKYFERKFLSGMENIFTGLGFFFRVPEKNMFFLTGLAGSGPGYLFYLAEIFHEILVEKGFSSSTAARIVSLLFEGSGEMMTRSGLNPRILKEKVSSPGGTTLAGLSVMQNRKLEDILREAISAAGKRAEELSKNS